MNRPEKFKNKYRIPSNRWQYWDYSAPGSYFITICIKGFEPILGNIHQGKMQLSAFGEIVENEFQNIADYHSRASLDAYIVMPNHVHGLISLREWDDKFSLQENHESPSIGSTMPSWWHDPNHQPTFEQIKQYRRLRRTMIIPKILGKFQMLTSKEINILRNTPAYKNWQRDYHDHVIRNETSWHKIRNYILNNPANWNDDVFHPDNQKNDDSTEELDP